MRFKLYISLLLCFLIILCTSSCTVDTASSISNSEVMNEQNTEQIVYCLWPDFTLEESIERANTIVHGTVLRKSETKIFDAYSDAGGHIEQYYRDVTVEVISCIKGSPTANKNNTQTVIYKELGGTIGSVTQKYTGFDIVNEGDEILIFLGEDDALISPVAFFIADSNKNITVKESMKSNHSSIFTNSANQEVDEISITEYSAAITNMINNQ